MWIYCISNLDVICTDMSCGFKVMCVDFRQYHFSPLILIDDGLEFAGQITVLLAQLVVAVTVLLDLILNIQ